jgi:ornithine carbamoyltransferase
MPKRDFLDLTDLSLAEAREVIALAARLKADPKNAHTTALAGRSVAVVLEKASTRTRVSFEVGVAQLGGHAVVLGVQGTQLGRGEPIKDTARVLARYCDAIVYRTSLTSRLLEMATARVPVINALSDDGHPVQVLCDVFTAEEALGPIEGKRVAFVGDCSCNMARSWLRAAKLFGFHLALAGPEAYPPPPAELAEAGAHASIVHDPEEAARNADVVNTDVWASMGQEDESEERARAFEGWTVNQRMLARANHGAIVMHCLPAHRGEEIDEATLEDPVRSRVWDQAENRLHVQKALLLWLLGLGALGA